ncbi:hypothetical protein J2S53_002125 [Actinopolyspora lacussalsi]|uniref:Uncharacterized protein n=1 Tax=Actinopolyspora righensis TaxID=995060 RepID=A0A1I7AI61_9ACTN|nr:hypothetical protein [Actinopolyspora righensis]MDP9642180.1 hypothetical protein [Actinopolyspora lacussalsi]SFT74570.1 hypothetical protein SAMN04487904_10772 [Actinopolyspora righensis]
MRPTGADEDGAMRASADRGADEVTTRPRIAAGRYRENADRATDAFHIVDGARRPGAVGRAFRGLTGALTAGLLVLAVALVGVQLWGSGLGGVGPGWRMLLGHGLASVAALLLQFAADRGSRPVAGWCSLAAMLVVLGTLTYWWWL